MLDLADKICEEVIVSICKEWKEIMFKEFKKNMTTIIKNGEPQ